MELAEQVLAAPPRANWDAAAQDEALLSAMKTGSHAAFEQLQNMYGRRLYQSILSITRNHEDAEDALQDTLMRAYRGLPSFEGRSLLSSWLTRIAINSALMIMRKRRSRPEISLEQQGTEEEGAVMDFRDHALNPEQLCDQNQRCERLERAIQGLHPNFRSALMIRVAKEKSVIEIADELEVSIASAKSRLHRARKRLRAFHPALASKAN